MSMLPPPAAHSASLDAAPANAARDHSTSLASEEHEKSDHGHSCEHTRPRGPLERGGAFLRPLGGSPRRVQAADRSARLEALHEPSAAPALQQGIPIPSARRPAWEDAPRRGMRRLTECGAARQDGTEVTGLDVSSGAVALARRRTEINGVSDRVHLVCSPIETAEIAPRSFDVIWGDGILHHVLDEFENVL